MSIHKDKLDKMFIRKTSNAVSFFLMADYAKVVEANVVINFRIIVLAHQRQPQVAVSKVFGDRVIQFKALELIRWAHNFLQAR